MKQEPSFDVIGLGCVCWDFVAIVRRYPQRDEKQELTQLLQQGGGPAATAMVAVARLGGRAAICGRIGDDDFGQKCRADFLAEGVDVSRLQQAPGHTSQFAFCVAEEGTGHRAIFWKHGSMGKLDPASLDREALLDCKCFLVDGHHLQAAIRAATWAREAGIPVVLDIEHYHPDNEALLQVCDYPILPESYALEHAGLDDPLEAGWRLHRHLGRHLIITRGAAGSVLFRDGQMHVQPAFPVSPLVDTTGAGDVYHGAFAFSLSRGCEILESMRFAAAVAALKCRALGGRQGIPGIQEAQELADASKTLD